MVIFLLALLPAAVFSLILGLAGDWGDLPRASFVVACVSVPALLALWAAPNRSVQWVAAGLLCVLAGVTAISVTGSDDAQAGLAILLNPIVALPLAGLFALFRLIRRTRRDPGSTPA